MIRVCPKRDTVCPHGMNCPYSIDRYECKPEPASATPDAPVMTLENGDILREGDYAKLRNGEVVGPLVVWDQEANSPWSDHIYEGTNIWRSDGSCVDVDFTIIAKATYSRTSRAENSPKLWKDMTPEEKGALLLARHERKTVEVFEVSRGDWVKPINFIFYDWNAYRIKPEVKRETVTLYWDYESGSAMITKMICDTHKITFDLIDGKPDPASIKMNEVE